MANVAGDNLFLFEGLRDTKGVVDHCLLDRVHLKDRDKWPTITTLVLQDFIFQRIGKATSLQRWSYFTSSQDSVFSVTILLWILSNTSGNKCNRILLMQLLLKRLLWLLVIGLRIKVFGKQVQRNTISSSLSVRKPMSISCLVCFVYYEYTSRSTAVKWQK